MTMDDGDWCKRDGNVDTALAGYCIAYCGISSALHHLSLHGRLSHPSSTPPLCSSRLVVTSHLVARLHLSTHRRITCCLSAPSPYIRQLAISRTAIFVAPLSAPRPSPASSNARCTLPAAASPMATVPSHTALVLQHVCLRAGHV